MPELAYVNGVYGPPDQAKVSIEDRGFQFGDGVYEVIIAYGGQPFLLDRHLDRLRASLKGIELELDFAAYPIPTIVQDGLRRSELGDALIYLQITRGAAPRSHVIPANLTPTIVMTVKPLIPISEELRRRGARVMTTTDLRWANCYIKATTLLPNLLAKNQAARRGYDDAIFVSPGGEVRECTASNLFVISGGALRIPPRNESILHGVTQGFLVELADAIGLSVQEETILLDALRAADEVFLSGTASEVLAITSIDDHPVADGKVGPITARLYAEFLRRTRG